MKHTIIAKDIKTGKMREFIFSAVNNLLVVEETDFEKQIKAMERWQKAEQKTSREFLNKTLKLK